MNLIKKILTDVEADIWEKEVESEIDFLTSEGQEFYPFKPENLREAIGEMSEVNMIIASSFAHASNKFHEQTTHDSYSASKFAFTLIEESVQYWRQAARGYAEKNVNRRM